MSLEEFLTDWHDDSPTLTVHTSGSTGRPKPLLVEKRRMQASARTTCRFLGLNAGDTALLCLPLDYIAGKMMVVRALTCGLHLVSVPPTGHPLSDSMWESLQQQTRGEDKLTIDFAAMVPLQVYNSLQVAEERQRLSQIHQLIIGGGPVDDALASKLRSFPNAVWSTYGMTETLSHIALRRLSGPDADEWYTPFEGVSISTDSEGCLIIDAPEICTEKIITNDLAELCPPLPPSGEKLGELSITKNTRGASGPRFRILGRRDNIICSGGLKIITEEVEKRLRPLLSAPFIITKAPDEKLGEQLVLLTESTETEEVADVCRRILSHYEQPRRIICVSSIPMTPNGKPARKEAEKLAASAIGTQS